MLVLSLVTILPALIYLITSMNGLNRSITLQLNAMNGTLQASMEQWRVSEAELERRLLTMQENFTIIHNELQASDEKFVKQLETLQESLTTTNQNLLDLDSKFVTQLETMENNFKETYNTLRDTVWRFHGYAASNGYGYIITETSQTFQESRDVCVRMGGHLAYLGIRNAAIHSEIIQNVEAGWRGFYIDLTDIETEGQFQWRDGVLASEGWTNWNDGEPSNSDGNEHCVDVSEETEKWNDLRCDQSNKALCEILI